MNNNLAIYTENLSKIYNKNNVKVTALDNFSIEIPKGCIYGLLGPNGAGKSTFINIIAGLVKKNSGEVNVGGIELNKNPIEIFSELSGISSLGALLAAGQYPQVADPAPPSFPITQYGNPPVYDAYFNPPALEYRIANYDTYQQACEDVGGYYLQSGISNEIAIQNFFSQFAHGKLTELAQIDPISNSAAHESKVAELAVGLRALMALSYDAAPLWTSYGVGYSNAANPMVGNTDNSQPLIPQLSTQTFLDN